MPAVFRPSLAFLPLSLLSLALAPTGKVTASSESLARCTASLRSILSSPV